MKKIVCAVLLCLLIATCFIACSEREQKIVVSFETNGGSSISARETTVADPPISKKDGFRLEGWYRDSDFRERAVFPFSPTADCVLYANWTDITTGSLGIKYEKNATLDAFIASSFSGNSISVCVPDTHLGLPVVGIKKGFLKIKSYVVNFCIGKNVTEIEEEFYRCYSLNSFEIIGSNERYEIDGDSLCDKKEDKIVAYPVALKKDIFSFDRTLAKNALIYNDNIQKIVFGENAKAEDGAFEGLKSLKEFSVNESNGYYKAVDGILYSKDEQILYRYPQGKKGDEYAVSDKTVTVSEAAFEQTALKKITLGKNVKEFFDFSSVPLLEEIAVDKNNAYFQSIDGALYSSDGKTAVRFPCAKTGEYSVKQDTEIIGEFAFSECKISSVVLPKSVKNVKEFAFNFCVNLEKVRFEKESELTYLAENSLVGCTGLKTFILTTRRPPQTAAALFSATSSDLKIVVPSNVKEAYAYYWDFAASKLSDTGTAVTNYTVLFDANGGSEVSEIHGAFILKAPSTKKEGAIFLYWADEDGSEVVFPYFIEGYKRFYAVWSE